MIKHKLIKEMIKVTIISSITVIVTTQYYHKYKHDKFKQNNIVIVEEQNKEKENIYKDLEIKTYDRTNIQGIVNIYIKDIGTKQIYKEQYNGIVKIKEQGKGGELAEIDVYVEEQEVE